MAERKGRGIFWVIRKKTYEQDILIKKELIKAYTQDILILKQLLKTYDLDLLIKKQNLTKTYNIDLNIVKQLLKTYTQDILIKKYGATKTYEQDVLIKKTGLTKTYDIDLEITKQFTKTYNIDIIIKKIQVKTYSQDLLIKKQNLTKSYNIDLIIKKIITGQYDVDILIKKQNLTKSYEQDIIITIQATQQTKTYTTDILLTKFQPSVVDKIRKDITTILQENGLYGTLIKPTTTKDSLGGVTTSSKTEITIQFMMSPLSQKDRELDTQGILKQGDVAGIFKYQYTSEGTDYQVEIGDIIKIDANNRYRIIGMRDIGRGNMVAFKRGILRKII